MKTYYCSSNITKKSSVEKIINDMSNNQESFKELFNREFRELTEIGNSFSIRHHETTQTIVQDKRYYDYFYKRCMSLITIATQYLEGLSL